jgi:hypothetical protein
LRWRGFLTEGVASASLCFPGVDGKFVRILPGLIEPLRDWAEPSGDAMCGFLSGPREEEERSVSAATLTRKERKSDLYKIESSQLHSTTAFESAEG